MSLSIAILRKGVTQKMVAREAGISESIISLAVRGRYLLDDNQKNAIARVLGEPRKQIFAEDAKLPLFSKKRVLEFINGRS